LPDVVTIQVNETFLTIHVSQDDGAAVGRTSTSMQRYGTSRVS